MRRKTLSGLGVILTLAAIACTLPSGEKESGSVKLFNGKDLTGWKLKQDKYTVTKFVSEQGEVIPGAKEAKVDQKLAVVDAKGKVIEGAKIDKVDRKE